MADLKPKIGDILVSHGACPGSEWLVVDYSYGSYFLKPLNDELDHPFSLSLRPEYSDQGYYGFAWLSSGVWSNKGRKPATDPFKDFTEDDWLELSEADTDILDTVVYDTVEDRRRWVTVMSKVFHYLPDDTYWRVYWEVGNTENQEPDFAPWYEQVQPVEVTTTVYKRIA